MFKKQRTCPTAETLLRRAQNAAVARHVAGCDFCGAEAELLSRFPPPTTKGLPFVALSMPRALHRLAEELMKEASLNRARFADAVMEVDRLTFTDA
ncbi:MAG TPA: hypothetical protein VK422_13045 [Pyrinomonadaceae bacterium]|nr:hypothetical protein [Pyrinomonadaceae bacterium]